MFGVFWMFAEVSLVILGVWWCKEMFAKMGDDLATIRNPKHPGERWAVAFIWLLTGFVIVVTGCLVLNLAMPFVNLL
jgi:hypothetical protein